MKYYLLFHCIQHIWEQSCPIDIDITICNCLVITCIRSYNLCRLRWEGEHVHSPYRKTTELYTYYLTKKTELVSTSSLKYTLWHCVNYVYTEKLSRPTVVNFFYQHMSDILILTSPSGLSPMRLHPNPFRCVRTAVRVGPINLPVASPRTDADAGSKLDYLTAALNSPACGAERENMTLVITHTRHGTRGWSIGFNVNLFCTANCSNLTYVRRTRGRNHVHDVYAAAKITRQLRKVILCEAFLRKRSSNRWRK